MIVVGLTGGIGSGKSTVAQSLSRRGAVVIDADAIVRELQQPGAPMLDALAERFGADVIRPDGSLDRARLAELAFADAAHVADLNAIVHPPVREEIRRRLADHADTDDVVVLDIPLITDRSTWPVAAIVVVDVPAETAIQRVVAGRRLSPEQVRARMANQISREQRLALADRVIDNSGDLAALEPQLDDLWAWMQTLPETPRELTGPLDRT